MAEIILASGSPRRYELLTMAGYSVKVMPTDADENTEGMTPSECVSELSRRKAEASRESGVVIAADTVVALDGEILGKPRDSEDAKAMLGRLSGRSHSVFTGFTVKCGDKSVTEAVETKVYMREITEAEIDAYVATGNSLDKAGAYGIQGRAGMFISHIEGDYYTVVGLPLCRLSEVLRDEFEISPNL